MSTLLDYCVYSVDCYIMIVNYYIRKSTTVQYKSTIMLCPVNYGVNSQLLLCAGDQGAYWTKAWIDGASRLTEEAVLQGPPGARFAARRDVQV